MPFRTAPQTQLQYRNGIFPDHTSNVNDMKKFFCSNAMLSPLFLLLLCCTTGFSQITTTWKGGAPGLENDWNCPRNWSNYAVPDAFSNVIIPDVSTTSLAAPLLKTGKVEVNTLFLESNAKFTVEEGAQLVVLQESGSFLPADFHPKGRIFLLNETTDLQAGANADKIK